MLHAYEMCGCVHVLDCKTYSVTNSIIYMALPKNRPAGAHNAIPKQGVTHESSMNHDRSTRRPYVGPQTGVISIDFGQNTHRKH